MANDDFDLKSCAALYILKVLQQHSDAEHPLTQQKILEYLRRDHDLEIERKKAARDLERLQKVKFPVVHDHGGYYLERDFVDSELRFLIDSVRFSDQISHQHRRDLVKKLSGLGSARLRRQCAVTDVQSAADLRKKNFFLHAEDITGAIEAEHQLRVWRGAYEIDGQLHDDGQPITVNPIALVSIGGRCFLAATVVQKTSSAKNGAPPIFINLDHVQKVEDIKRRRQSVPYEDIVTMLKEHPFALPGKTERVMLRLLRTLIPDLIETFGTQYRCIDNADPAYVTVTLLAGECDVKRWVLMQAPFVQVLRPERLCKEVRRAAKMLQDVNKWQITPYDERDAAIRHALGRDGVLRLHQTGLTDPAAFKDLQGVVGVELTANGFSDLSFLAGFPALRYVRIEGEKATDLSCLASLPELQWLEVHDMLVRSPDFLRDCRHLRRLTLSACDFECGEIPVFDMPWLRLLCVDPAHLCNVDMHDLRKANPQLTVLTDLDDLYHLPASTAPILHRNWDFKETMPYPFEVMLLIWIFGERPDGFPADYVKWLTENDDYRREMQSVCAALGLNERRVLEGKLTGRSIAEIAADILLSCEATDVLFARALRRLRHPTLARRLRPYTFGNSPFAPRKDSEREG